MNGVVKTWWDFARYMLVTAMVFGIMVGGIHLIHGWYETGIPIFFVGCVAGGGWYAVITNKWMTKP